MHSKAVGNLWQVPMVDARYSAPGGEDTFPRRLGRGMKEAPLLTTTPEVLKGRLSALPIEPGAFDRLT